MNHVVGQILEVNEDNGRIILQDQKTSRPNSYWLPPEYPDKNLAFTVANLAHGSEELVEIIYYNKFLRIQNIISSIKYHNA